MPAATTGAQVIGTGPGSCTESMLSAAVAQGGVITFNCGMNATIPISSEIELPRDKDTVIDGGNQITLDGGHATRLFHFDGGNFQVTTTTVTFQHITLQNAKATGTMMFASAQPPCSQGYKDGGGGAILFNDGILHVYDVHFLNNTGATPGPDVAGGAIWVTGCKESTIVRSYFEGNQGSNGGAIGSLWGNLSVYNSVFVNNQATGTGANSVDPNMCSVMGNQIGSGGNGGAISIDGGEAWDVTFCGDTFMGNQGGKGALAGAVFRTPDKAKQKTTFDRCTFDSNQGDAAGALYFHNSNLVVMASTFVNNQANVSGAIQADGTTLTFTNDTFTGNTALTSPGGTISLFGGDGTVTNCTFAGNQTKGAAGMSFGADLFGAAPLMIQNTIFANSVSMDSSHPSCQAGATGAQDLQWPMSEQGDPCVPGIQFGDPMLGALANNGGPTKTMLPGAGSAALKMGKNCPSTDQRGNPRASQCTLGAVEVP